MASFFDKKARLWIKGRKNFASTSYTESIWFHFLSSGDFEQGHPVLEQTRNSNPDIKIVITFFSPSGYQLGKNTPMADAVYYLPFDTQKHARLFIETINPKLVIFTKCEYKYHFFNELHQRNIPLYVISGVFRTNQVFFKWYGKLHREMLSFVKMFFVQDEQSMQLLSAIGINKVIVSGDTRFDRVWANAQEPKPITAIEDFKNGKNIFVAGSTWPADEKLLSSIVKENRDWKFIFVPHEISEGKIKSLISLLPPKSAIRHSQIASSAPHLSTYRVMIIDNLGMLSALYQYGKIAFIGGGFGAGIHNTLEAASVGLPVIFGPNYLKFKEAHDLIELKAGFTVTDETSLKVITNKLINDKQYYNEASKETKNYVKEHTGATKTIIDNMNSCIEN